jgi:hypothetical protein
VGLIAYHWFLSPEVTTSIDYKETIVVDSTYKDLYLDLKMEVNRQEASLNDSIEYFKELYKDQLGNIEIVSDTVFKDKPFIAPLRRFNGSRIHLYGMTRYNALVAGELLDMSIINDFKIPDITNTIYKETTITNTIEPKGALYVGGLVSQEMTFSVMAAYQRKNVQLVYQYDLPTKQNRIGGLFNVFRR